jgi:predicted aspartyl protease/Flp pilus assembly protein TadD
MPVHDQKKRINRAAAGTLAALIVSLVLCMSVPCVITASAADSTRRRAERALRNGEYELAERLFREIVEANANNTEARLGLSFSLLKQRRLREAYDHATRVAAVEPLSARAHALLGAALLASGDLRTSAEEFRRSLVIRDKEALAIAGLATLDYYENRFDDSIKGFRRAIALDSKEPDYLFNLAQVASRSEHYKEAAEAYERFLRVAPRTEEDRRARIRGLIDFLRYLGTVSRLHVPAGAQRAVVPFEAPDNLPVIEARINGSKEPLRFIIDTGASLTVISDETARRLGVSEVARGGFARGIGGNGRFGIVYGFLSSIDIGGARMENVPVYIRRLFTAGKHVDGYIGLAIISRYLTTIDYGTRTFTLDRQRSAAPDPSQPSSEEETAGGGIEIPLRTTLGGFMSGELRLEGIERPLNFIIDTGAGISVISEMFAMREELGRLTQTTRLRVYGAAGVAEDVKVLLLPKVVIGSYARENVPAAVLNLDSINESAGFEQAGIIGTNFLRHFRVTFDFPRGVVRVKPITAAQSEAGGTPHLKIVPPEQP